LDLSASPGDLTGALVQLVLARVRRELAAQETPGKEARISDEPGPQARKEVKGPKGSP
jgi:hypothetical protein